MKPRVGLSACLLGEPVRYDGAYKRAPLLLQVLGPHVEWVPVCPEVELGLGVPREPVELRAVAGELRLVGTQSGTDWTGPMRGYARARVDSLGALGGFVFKSNSPSCALASAQRIESGRVVAEDEAGLFAAAVRVARPALPVAEESALQNERALLEFLGRVREFSRGA